MTSVTDSEQTVHPRLSWIFFLAAAIVNGGLLWHFHNRYWYPTDDGLYAHIAERLLSGEVLNLDVQDIHPGYIHFLHAGAFWFFGPDMVSLRYPLIVAGFVQAYLVYALLRRRNVVLAAFGSVASTALGIIQFVSPSPDWYCLFLCVAVVWWLVWRPPAHPSRLVGAGVLIGVLTLFRQLSGVWVAMGVLTLILLEQSDPAHERGGLLAWALLLLMLGGLVGYLIVSPETEPGGVLLIAIWPIAILVWLIVNVRASSTIVAKSMAQLAVGASVPALPLVVYHLAHWSFGGWINDTVLAAFGETQMPFFGHGWYAVLPLAGLYEAVSFTDATKVTNGLYWATLPMVAAVNGILILTRLRRAPNIQDLALPIVAAFYALVSLYLEGPLYLYYAVGLSLIAVLWLSATGSRRRTIALAAATAGLSLVAVIFHAGQSRLRTPLEILEGHRDTETWGHGSGGLPRCSLDLPEVDRETYGRMLSLIQAHSQPNESIFVLPNDAELYFLANRRNPFRFYNSALGVRTADDLHAVLRHFNADPPHLVAFRPDDKYNTDASRQIMDVVRAMYTRTGTISGLEIYTLR
jgi:hypothetical protein